MGNTIRGNRVTMKFNGVHISCQTACELNFDTEMLPATNPDSDRWKQFLAGVRGWTMSVNANLLKLAGGADIKNIISAYYSGFPVQLEMGTHAGGLVELVFSGYALIQNGTLSASSTGNANYNTVFQGSGKLDVNIDDFGLIINAMPIEAEYPIIYNTTL